jgi:flavin-dependent thymidylate synthase
MNKVELIGWYGGDRAIARAAWTSTQADVESKTDEQIRDLIVYKLWNNGTGKAHKTPFERGIVEFNVTLDAASHIHALKHRLANINGESARYKELKDDRFYIPDDWADIKAATLTGEYLEKHNGKTWRQILETHTKISDQLYHAALADIAPVLGRKRAKESARFFKTYNSQITLSIMMNMSCFHNFYTLRADKAEQLEIQDIARNMLSAIKCIPGEPFKFTLEAFGF